MKKISSLIAMAFIVHVAYAEPMPPKKLVLTLHDAILLAVRTNPNVQQSQLNYLSQKLNLKVQEWQFKPHYSLQAGYTQNRFTSTGYLSNTATNTGNWNVTPAVSLATGIGTQMSLTSTNNNSSSSSYTPGLSLDIMQPLMRGFGSAVVESALYNAKDSEQIAQLTIEGTLRTTVTAVINAYLDVVTAERAIIIDKDALQRAQKSVEQTRLYIKAGHKAGNEIVTVEANVASTKSQLENDRNNLLQARYGLLAAIGIDPNTEVEIKSLDVDALINKYQLPTVSDVKKMVLKNDIQYQVDDITLHGSTARSVLVAKDNLRWQLNLHANAAVGSAKTDTLNGNTGFGNNLTNTNQSENIAITLQVPIDDQMSKQALVNAKIALQEAELNFQQEKWAKETGAINGYNQVVSAKGAQGFAITAENLQQKTYTVSYQKYLHGLIDSLELQSAQMQLIQSQQTLLTARIMYLKALVGLDLLTGNTLKTWDVKVKNEVKNAFY